RACRPLPPLFLPDALPIWPYVRERTKPLGDIRHTRSKLTRKNKMNSESIMKKTALISLFIIFVAVGFTVFYLSLKNSGTPAIDARAADTNNADLATLVHQNAAYRNKIKELQQENRNLQKQLGTPPTDERPATLELTDQATPASTDAPNNVDQHQQSVASAMELTAYFSTFSARSPADIDRDLSNKFAKEDIDYSWASSHEIKLAKLFTENEQLTEFVPENISCKTTRCRVT